MKRSFFVDSPWSLCLLRRSTNISWLLSTFWGGWQGGNSRNTPIKSRIVFVLELCLDCICIHNICILDILLRWQGRWNCIPKSGSSIDNLVDWDICVRRKELSGNYSQGWVYFQVLTRVLGHYPERRQLLVDAGFTSLTKQGKGAQVDKYKDAKQDQF